MFCHIGLQATTTQISSYKMCQSYWMYHWQPEHECGTCMMVLRVVGDVLSNIMTDGQVHEDPLHDLHDRIESSGCLPVGLLLTTKSHLLRMPVRRHATAPTYCACLSDGTQRPRHLCLDAAARDETCRGAR
jgi:hypothetical protein